MTDDMQGFLTPGQYLQALLGERGWTQEVLATVLQVSPSHIGRLAQDRQPIDAERALALSEVFHIPAERFLELQRDYDLAQARIRTRPDPRRAMRAQLYADLPLKEMIRRGWLATEDLLDPSSVEHALTKFFGVATADDIPILPHAAKKTVVSEPITGAQLAWLYRVRQIADNMVVRPYSTAKMHRAITELKSLLAAPEEARKAPRILTEAGVRFVVVETLTTAKVDGVCFWLNPYSPVIGMTMRFDRIDNFWFVLRHECEHVLRGDGREVIAFDAELEGERAGTGAGVAEQERIANAAAADFCVPARTLKQFVARKAPIFTERDILGFSRVVKVHPGLVAGQLQHATQRYDRFRGHLAKIRSIVLPNAMHDGWGDVAPVVNS
jgi:HTH-type transcriptional regulator / antitoxin HigA